jgi:hypothetical protein
MNNIKSIVCVFITLVGIATIGVSSSAAAEMQGKSERYTEVGVLTSDGLNLIHVSYVHRGEDFYGYTGIGFPLLLNYGLGFSTMSDGSGLNLRIGVSGIAAAWNSSITYNFRLSGSDSLEMGSDTFK